MNQLSTAIYNALNGGATGSGAATGIYEKIAIPGATFPYVVFQKVTGTDEYTFGNHRTLRSVVYLIKAVDQGHDSQQAQQIMDNVDTDLHDAALSVNGYTTMSCVRESDMPSMTEVVQGTTYQYEGAYYRVFVAPTS